LHVEVLVVDCAVKRKFESWLLIAVRANIEAASPTELQPHSMLLQVEELCRIFFVAVAAGSREVAVLIVRCFGMVVASDGLLDCKASQTGSCLR